ncbi:hypothetical protein BJ165DRAFT_1401716 [Panaeolus papilionaceus]|nr:hypothetical protein BJ165DRAFT_1401716 [Panaeolus papilionaceus]
MILLLQGAVTFGLAPSSYVLFARQVTDGHATEGETAPVTVTFDWALDNPSPKIHSSDLVLPEGDQRRTRTDNGGSMHAAIEVSIALTSNFQADERAYRGYKPQMTASVYPIDGG